MQESFFPTERNYSLHYFLFLMVDYMFYKEDTVLMQAVGENNSECISEGETSFACLAGDLLHLTMASNEHDPTIGRT